jgi:hypothetical protein
MHHSIWDGLDLLSVIYISPHWIHLIFTMLYAPLSIEWTSSLQCYIHHSSKDILNLSSVICITLHGMDLISPVLDTRLS